MHGTAHLRSRMTRRPRPPPQQAAPLGSTPPKQGGQDEPPAKKAAAGMLAGVQAGRAQARLDKRLAADAARARDVDMMPLADVQGRLGGLDTREPTPEALDALTESIDALGLLEPLAVDKLGRLLAGKARLIALRRLAAKDPTAGARCPCAGWTLTPKPTPPAPWPWKWPKRATPGLYARRSARPG